VRRFTIVQDLPMSADEHWRIFFDDAFERALYDEKLRFPKYELVENRDQGETVRRKVRVTPRLDAPAPVLKVLGSSFGYVEDGTFEKKARVWRSRIITNVIADRLGTSFVVRADAAGEGRCRRTIDLDIDVKIFGIGGLVEAAFEKNLRDGWRDSLAFMIEWARRHPIAAPATSPASPPAQG
jgi:hypothetical protein